MPVVPCHAAKDICRKESQEIADSEQVSYNSRALQALMGFAETAERIHTRLAASAVSTGTANLIQTQSSPSKPSQSVIGPDTAKSLGLEGIADTDSSEGKSQANFSPSSYKFEPAKSAPSEINDPALESVEHLTLSPLPERAPLFDGSSLPPDDPTAVALL